MQHLVAVRTYGTEVADRVDEIALANGGNRNEVMDVDKTTTYVAIAGLEVKTANRA